MLAKKFHLSGGSDVFRKQKSLRANYFYLKRVENGLPFSRLGVVISRKVEKSAVRRNKWRRIFFDCARLSKFYEKPGADFLVVVSPRAFEAPREEVEVELRKFLAL